MRGKDQYAVYFWILIVSTLKILMQHWRPELESGLTKTATHLALDDIRESIEEMRYYREHFLKLD